MSNFQFAPSTQHGGLGKGYDVLGEDLPHLLEEPNLKLVA